MVVEVVEVVYTELEVVAEALVATEAEKQDQRVGKLKQRMY